MYLYVDTFPRLAPVQYHTVRCWTIKLDYIRSTLAIDSEKGLELVFKNCHFMKLVSSAGGTSLTICTGVAVSLTTSTLHGTFTKLYIITTQ